MLFLVFYICLLHGSTIHGLPQAPAPGCTPDPQPAFTENFDGFNEPKDLCAEKPGSYSYRLSYNDWLNVDATTLQPSAPIVPETPQEPYKPILFAATPLTTRSKTPSIAAYRDDEDNETFDLITLGFQCRSFGFNEADKSKCNQAAVPMQCDFTVTCTPADGSANVVQTFSYTPNDARQNALKNIDFTTTPGKDFKRLATCQFAATTPKLTVTTTLTAILTQTFALVTNLLGALLGQKVQDFMAQSTKGTVLLIDNLTTAVTKCHIG